MSTYMLISSDSHIIEPADLWEQRIDRKFRDRAPRLVHEAYADQWYAGGVRFGNIGINQLSVSPTPIGSKGLPC
jgi:hypothetical protein